MSRLPRIRVVMVETWHPGNIGSAARAMKTMGLRDLWLVGPRHYPDPQATALAAEAIDVLERARIVKTLDEAIADCAMVIASSARLRSNEAPPLTVDQATEKLLSSTASGPAALVFGPERAGLTAADIDRCQHVCKLPTADDCRSVNVAQAVQVFAYALRRADQEVESFEQPRLASIQAREQLYEALQHALTRLNFTASEVAKQLPRYRELLSRADLTENEVRMMRGLLARIDQRAAPHDRPEAGAP